MKKYKLLMISIAVLVVAGISLAFAGGHLQGLIFMSKPIFRDVSPVNQKNLGAIKTTIPGSSCNQTNFKTAFILLVRNPKDATKEVLDAVNFRKKQTSTAFSQATSNLATMDTSDPLVIIKKEDSWGTPDIQTKTVKKFYETNNDIYDFIIIIKAFEDDAFEDGSYGAVTRKIEGIGLPIENTASTYGSKGYLKGIAVFNHLNNWLSTSFHPDPYQPINVILHEIEHQWGVGVGDDFTGNGGNLEIKKDNIHFYRGLQSPSVTGDPMYAANWVSNGDGTFRAEDEPGYKKYHPFMLYFMGLLPKSEYGIKYTLYDGGAHGEKMSTATPYKEVSVNDIIAVEGERKCQQSDTRLSPIKGVNH